MTRFCLAINLKGISFVDDEPFYKPCSTTITFFFHKFNKHWNKLGGLNVEILK